MFSVSSGINAILALEIATSKAKISYLGYSPKSQRLMPVLFGRGGMYPW